MTLAHAFAPDPALARAAEIVITRCLSLVPEQSFLLIYDETTSGFPELFQAAAAALGVEYTEFFVPQELQERPAEAFTPELVHAIHRAQGILMATTGAVRCDGFRITLTTDKRGADCKVATMPGVTMDVLRTAIDVDYDEIRREALRLTPPLLRGDRCRITTYDRDGAEHVLEMSLGGMQRIPIQSLGIIPPNAWGNVPAAEIFIAPMEDSAEGEFLVNGAVGTELLPGGREALLEFRGGRLTAHRYVGTAGRVRALDEIEQIARDKGHADRWHVIAELGIGLNRMIPRFTGIPLVDEKKHGTVHVAIGHNKGYGGINDCRSLHFDMTTAGPTVEIDGHTLIRRGEHVVDPAPFLESWRAFAAAGDAAGWSSVVFKPRSYVLEDGALLVRRFTGAGRETLYAIGDGETCRLAHRLARLAVDDVLDVQSAARRLNVPPATVRAVLAMLAFHEVVSP